MAAQALIPAQSAALADIHKQLAAISAAEGKGGPPAAALVASLNADLLAFYQNLLGIPVAK